MRMGQARRHLEAFPQIPLLNCTRSLCRASICIHSTMRLSLLVLLPVNLNLLTHQQPLLWCISVTQGSKALYPVVALLHPVVWFLPAQQAVSLQPAVFQGLLRGWAQRFDSRRQTSVKLRVLSTDLAIRHLWESWTRLQGFSSKTHNLVALGTLRHQMDYPHTLLLQAFSPQTSSSSQLNTTQLKHPLQVLPRETPARAASQWKNMRSSHAKSLPTVQTADHPAKVLIYILML